MQNALTVLDGGKSDVDVAVDLGYQAFVTRLKESEQLALAWLHDEQRGFGRFLTFIKNEGDRASAREQLLSRAASAGALS